MHNSKIKLQSQDDFYNALSGAIETSDQLVKENCKNENAEVKELVRERMDSFLKELATIASANVQLPDGNPIDLSLFDTEPCDQRLEDEASEMENQMRKELERLVQQRRNILNQLQPLAREIVSHEASTDQIVFESDQDEEDDISTGTKEDNEDESTTDRDTMLKEYQDAMKMLPNLEKILMETTMETEQLKDVLEAGKLL